MAKTSPRFQSGLMSLLGAWVLVATAASSAFAQEGPKVEVRRGEAATLWVWNRRIVTLYAEVMGITPKERVDRIGGKINEILAEGPGEAVTRALGTLGNLSGYWVLIDGRQVMGLLPEDADTSVGQTLGELAGETVAKLQAALDARREQQSLPRLLKAIGLALTATAIFGIAIGLVLRLHRRALSRGRLLAKVDVKLGGVTLRPLLEALERGTVKLTTFGLVVIATYLWFTFVFGLHPYTRPWGEGLAEFLIDLLKRLGGGVLDAIPGLFTVLVIFVLTRILVRGVDGFFRSVELGAMSVPWLAPDTAKATRRLSGTLIWIFALTVAYPYIPGSDSDAFKGISVFVGLMVSLGSAGLINQVMSGLVVAYSRALKTGDYVRVGETEGTVSDVGMLSTKVVTPKREAITVPNAVLVGSPITNYSRLAEDQGSIVGTTVTIGYDAPWRQVHAMLELAAARTPGVRQEPKPFVLQRSLSDFYPEYQLVVHLDRPETRIRILSDLHANIQDVFNEYGVQIMSPHFMAQPAENVWVPRAQWYPAPAKADGDKAASPG